MGGTRLAQNINGNIGTSLVRLTSIFPTAQLKAASIARASAAGFRSAPVVNPIRTSPASATPKPISCRRSGRSRRRQAAGVTVKNTCGCWGTEARPAGIPSVKAKNSNKNWPANRAKPMPRSARPKPWFWARTLRAHRRQQTSAWLAAGRKSFADRIHTHT